MTDLTALQALGRFMQTHDHGGQPDPERSWLRRPSAAPCAACRELQATLGLEPSPVETSA
jgi:hypothetical protein